MTTPTPVLRYPPSNPQRQDPHPASIGPSIQRTSEASRRILAQQALENHSASDSDEAITPLRQRTANNSKQPPAKPRLTQLLANPEPGADRSPQRLTPGSQPSAITSVYYSRRGKLPGRPQDLVSSPSAPPATAHEEMARMDPNSLFGNPRSPVQSPSKKLPSLPPLDPNEVSLYRPSDLERYAREASQE